MYVHIVPELLVTLNIGLLLSINNRTHLGEKLLYRRKHKRYMHTCNSSNTGKSVLPDLYAHTLGCTVPKSAQHPMESMDICMMYFTMHAVCVLHCSVLTHSLQ